MSITSLQSGFTKNSASRWREPVAKTYSATGNTSTRMPWRDCSPDGARLRDPGSTFCRRVFAEELASANSQHATKVQAAWPTGIRPKEASICEVYVPQPNCLHNLRMVQTYHRQERTTPNLTIAQQRGLSCVRSGSENKKSSIVNKAGITVEEQNWRPRLQGGLLLRGRPFRCFLIEPVYCRS